MRFNDFRSFFMEIAKKQIDKGIIVQNGAQINATTANESTLKSYRKLYMIIYLRLLR